MLNIKNNKIILSPSKTFLKYDWFWGLYMGFPPQSLFLVFKKMCLICMKKSAITRGVSWSLPVFSIEKTLNSQGNLKKILFKVLTIGVYTFRPSFRQIMDTIPKKLFLFQGKPFDEPFFDFSKIGEALLCEWVSHRCEKVIVGRGEVWRVRQMR